MEDNAASLSSEEGGSVPESPKPMAFTIDFGGGKSVDSSRHKTLVEKYQKKHRRGQSLSKLDDSPTSTTGTTPTALKKHPLSANLPRRAASVQSEGYSSCDEKVERYKNNVRLRDGLSLPLKNVNSDKMTQSCTLPSIESPDVEIVDVITPESPTITSPQPETDHFIDGAEFDFDKSDTASDAGTYTLDADNYTEEQKARMSIDRDFKIEKVTVFRKTQEYVQSLTAQNNVPRKLSPIVSPTQNFSIIEDAPKVNNDDPNRIMTKIMFPSPKAKTGINLERPLDQGSIISVTSSGAFRSKSENERRHMRKLSLTKSEVHVEAYTYNSCCTTELARPNLSANLVLVSENVPTNPPIEKLVNLPPPIGGICGKISPTKIPSPIHTARPRSRNSSHNVDLSDSSLETESYLKPTQNLLNSLQQRLSLESDHDSEYLNNDARNLLKKPTHLRHNSLDDRNLKISNKLEHFQTKNFIDQTYTNVLNQYSHTKVHKIQNSPNNSPIRRSSSFSTKNQINTKCSNIPQQKESNIRNSPSFARNGSIQRSSSTASMRPGAMLLRRSSVNQFGDTESSSEEDLKEIIKKQDITNTRYNRAFSLRRARLDEPPPAPKCPNTPEMRRKFQPDGRAERAISVDRKPMRTNDVQSRYMQNVTRGKTAPPQVQAAKVAEVKGSPKNVKSVKVAAAVAVKPQVFSRTDTGRFSMRTAKPPPVTNSQKTIRKEFMGKKPSGPRSNSSLTSKEVDFQNWKRRKSYDPMKAAAEGKRKAEMAKKQTSQNPMTQSYHEGNQDYDDSSPSHSSSVHRSQSFHGTAALEQYISSEEEEDLTLSPDEGFSPPTPSPCELSPNRMHLRYAWKDQLLH